MKKLRFLFLLLPVLLLTGFASKKQLPSTVTFHVECNPRDTESFAVPIRLKNPPRDTFVEKMASITEREIESIYPLKAADGSMGCVFKLDDHGRIWLDTLSVEKRGMSIVAFVNGRQIVDMLIDKRVSDGIITIPGGLTNEDILELVKRHRIMGQKKKYSWRDL